MTVTISRHPFPRENAAAGISVLENNAEGLIESLETSSTRLGDAFELTLTLAKSHCLLDTEASRLPTWKAWVNAMQVGSATFATATMVEGEVHCRIAEKDRALHATGPQYYAHAGAWLTAFYLAVACREKNRLTALCQVPVSLLRQSSAPFDEFVYAWIETLQDYWLGGPDLGAKLVAAIDGTDPSRDHISDPETTAKILYPPMEMFHRLVREDHSGFNQALADALQWHKEYWSTEDNSLQATGLVALPALAVACLAYDAGFPIEVESEYLPIALLERDWPGEFPT
ncbi:immunity 49 family protein [Streptomyces sp. C11-1]|uniref:Immunity 49 family protein n=1 Tax=Streptomyces durocortorensis TaxID=2811104 RepID=A0ABY9VTX6_9ACTN|nr:immunity 49 family protein [Streptomyces durocortorensis]WNF27163.1 immunity 49 family protein [Streptomyces durocortorensis]